MRELLEMWERLEPARLVRLENRSFRFPPPVNATLSWLEGKFDKVAQAIILAATIEAVEAREWWLDIGARRSESGRKYAATVSMTDEPFYKVGWGDTVAEALLTAYLAALEAEGAS